MSDLLQILNLHNYDLLCENIYLSIIIYKVFSNLLKVSKAGARPLVLQGPQLYFEIPIFNVFSLSY